ncbi:hypothetical protein L903_26945 [Agrobacterium sp. JL28]|nr:hypothetical protein L902_24965 [Agrobacterium radiobacter DSM 30147]KVK43677.1 hypothetical protein L904_26920 [Agrobacterium sp. LY4]KVK43711.1 hypothetical protein L903_26945 [Agrobacterium sp. JL28]
MLSLPSKNITSVIPALSRNPADARLRGEKSLFSPRTWADWIPAQGRNDGEKTDDHSKIAHLADSNDYA